MSGVWRASRAVLGPSGAVSGLCGTSQETRGVLGVLLGRVTVPEAHATQPGSAKNAYECPTALWDTG
eukprot:909810-Pyramimonas_sp.AAC.1